MEGISQGISMGAGKEGEQVPWRMALLGLGLRCELFVPRAKPIVSLLLRPLSCHGRACPLLRAWVTVP